MISESSCLRVAVSDHWKQDHEWADVTPLWTADCKTMFGVQQLTEWLDAPLRQQTDIDRFQSALQWWVERPALLFDIRNALRHLKPHEHALDIQHDAFTSEIHFQSDWLQSWNSLWLIHVPWTLSQMYIQPLMQFLLPLLTLLVPIFVLGRMNVQIDAMRIFRGAMQMIQLIWRMRSIIFVNGWTRQNILLLVQGIISVGFYFYGIWVCIRTAWYLHKLYRNILQSIRHSVEWSKEVYQIWGKLQTSGFDMTSYGTWRDSFGDLSKPYQHPLEDLLPEEHGEGLFWWYWPLHRWLTPALLTGRYWNWVHAENNMVWEGWKRFIGYLDGLTTIAEWLVRYSTVITMPTWIQSGKEGSWGWVGGYHPIARRSGVNWLQDDWIWEPRTSHLLVTGGNAYGKTTFLKTMGWMMWMGQSWGIVPASQCRLVRMDGWNSFVRVPDEVGSVSLFQAEVERAMQILRQVREQKGNTWIWMDEMFSSTNPEEAMACIWGFLRQIVELPNVWSGYASHYVKLGMLEGVTSGVLRTIAFDEPYIWKWGISRVRCGVQELERRAIREKEDKWVSYVKEGLANISI